MVLAWLLMGLASGYLAEKKGRSFPFWFVMGAAFGIFAVLVLVFLPEVGVESKTVLRQMNPDVIEVKVEEVLPPEDKEIWFYIDVRGEQKGPVTKAVLDKALLEGSVTEESYIWRQGMESWEPLKTVIKKPL